MSAAGFSAGTLSFLRLAQLVLEAPDGARIALIAPSLARARDEWGDALRELLDRCDGSSCAAGYSSGSRERFTFPGDVQVLLLSSAQPDRMRGLKIWRGVEIYE